MLKNKKILFICPPFYNYHHEIIDELNNLGAQVIFVADLAQNNPLFPLVKRYRFIEGMYTKFKIREIKKILNNQSIDYLFVIRGFIINKKLMALFEDSSIKKIMYQWDSLRYFDYSNKTHHFDEVFTFDIQDSQLKQFQYLPLFYQKKVIPSSIPPSIDVLFICSYTDERAAFAANLKKEADRKGLSSKLIIYQPFLSYVKRYFKGQKINDGIEYIFKPLVFERVVELMNKSKCIIDYCHENQNGLTMRTVEVLALKKNLVTNNRNIVQHAFFNDRQITLFDGYDMHDRLPLATYLDEEKRSDISFLRIDRWVINIFNGNGFKEKFR